MSTSSRGAGKAAARVAVAVAVAALLVFAASASPAVAKTIRPYVYSGESFTGAGDPQVQAFNPARFVAVDDQTGTVYVLDNGNGGLLRKFDADGNPVPFSAPERGGERSISVGAWSESGGSGIGAEVVVDNSGGPTQGNVYVGRVAFAPSEPLVFGFKPSGALLSANWPICGLSCGKADHWLGFSGLAVDPDGEPWVSSVPFVGTPPHELNPFDVSGVRSKVKDTFVIGQVGHSIFGDACCKDGSTILVPRRFLFDDENNLYATGNSIVGCSCGFRMIKYGPNKELLNPTFSPLITSTAGGGESGQLAIDRTSNEIFINYGDRVEVYNPEGKLIDTIGQGQLTASTGTAVNSSSDRLYVTNGTGANKVDIYEPGPQVTVPDAATGDPSSVSASTAVLTAVIDPDNGGDTTECYFEYGITSGAMSNKVPCDDQVLESDGGPQAVTGEAKELDCQIAGPLCALLPKVKGNKYFYRVVVKNAAGPPQSGEIKSFRNSDPPAIGDPTVNDVNSDGADLDFSIHPEGGETEVRVEYGTTAAYGSVIEEQFPLAYSERPDTAKDMSIRLTDLQPDTTYHFKIVAESPGGSTETADTTFRTFAASEPRGSCPNALTRQQTGASLLLDCRAYELVSAADQGGYNVESDLVPGQKPYRGFPQADGKVLYGINGGGIPNTGSPTIRGVDPYVATRGESGWETAYVGIPVAGTPSLEPFSSTATAADSGLGTFAFGGGDICDPCFGDGSSGIPVRLPNGDLVQGMVGSLPVSKPVPAGEVRKQMSDDGTHLIFGSEQKFEPEGNAGSVTIYDRDLVNQETQVASTLPNGATMTGEVAALDVSADGSRILIGRRVSTDSDGNDYFDLFMHVGGSANSVAVADTAQGVIYAGMSSDGREVLFATKDQLADDTDESADMFRATVGAGVQVTRVSTGSGGSGDTDACSPAGNWNGGSDCGILAIAGGGGVATDDGTAYFLSPELLDGANGTAGQPNLYTAAPGGPPRFVATLETGNPAVVGAREDSEVRDTADFQVNASGEVAVFTSTLPMEPGFDNGGHAQVYRYDHEENEISCVSCTPTNAPASGSASLASNGLSVTDDGRVFFNSPDPLALRDSNGRQDVYQWSDGTVELISSGTNENPSSLLSATADGVDVFFFTRESRVPQDENGPVVKIYDARSGGGFFLEAGSHPCKASDECHGPSSAPAPAPIIQSTQGTPGQFTPEPPRRCRRGFVKRRGKCVRKRAKKRRAGKKGRRGARGKRGKRNRRARKRQRKAGARRASRRHAAGPEGARRG